MTTIQNFGDFSAEWYKLNHPLDDIDAAYDLLMNDGYRFMEEDWHIYIWHIGLASQMGKKEEANRVFKQALDEGLWWPSHWFAMEDEFCNVPDPELVAICAEREAHAKITWQPQITIRNPLSEKPLLFTMHRNHQSVERDVPNWQPAFDLGYAFAMPNSSQVMGPYSEVWDDRETAIRDLKQHFATLKGNFKEVITAGFMTGGTIAARLALAGDIPAKGFITMSPSIPEFEDVFKPLVESGQAADVRGYIIVGETDPRCYKDAVALAELLQKANIPVKLNVDPELTQNYPSNFRDVLQEACDFILVQV